MGTTKPIEAIQRRPSLGAYAPIRRILALAAILRRGEPCTAVSLAAKLLANSRTIKRDIEFPRDIGWVLRWQRAERSYALESAPPARLI